MMKESDIRPQDVFDEYLRLSRLDAESCFSAERLFVPCVACGNPAPRKAFQKSGFDYVECSECLSLFQSPRPPAEEFERFYEDSLSSRYWAERFFPALMKNRRELIFAPRARDVNDLCQRMGFQPGSVLDVGAGYGLFLEEWKKLQPQTTLLAIEPGQKLATICREKGIDVLETTAEKALLWKDRADLTVCFEVIEHVYNPLQFVSALFQLVKPGGIVIVSGLGCEGFDVQLLWEHSKSVSPPHHINFMSVAGFKTLFQRAGFTEVSVKTPGRLDVDIVMNNFEKMGGSFGSQRFVRSLLNRGPEARQEFQAFLSKYQLSSHVWIVAQRPTILHT